ncbi:LysE family translocator [Streptomyces sp. ISL-43]|uniref:LysE family translocator n=1 Tax=Streptomyces sp. ISL-43 TaxID=2819183 RepID=UPI001BE8AE75|nr:LysE family translocator [Streptomyces sp. ISL-43]MBT2447419.1 LysE family translocator [Streptomyces sp. ISL-43]
MRTRLPVFLITTWLLAMLPGASLALMTRQTLEGGLRVARATIAGNATGLLIWSTAASAGLSAVLLADPTAYAVVRVAGGIVLIVLGVNTLRAAQGAAAPHPTTGDGPGNRLWRGYTRGLGTNLGNPKAGVFAVSVLPQFVTAQGPVLVSSIALGALWALVTACWYVLFTWAVSRGRALVSRPAVQRGLRAVTGFALLLLGVTVATGM